MKLLSLFFVLALTWVHAAELKSLEDITCELGKGIVDCSTIKVQAKGEELLDVTFKGHGKDLHYTLKKKCAETLPKIYKFFEEQPHTNNPEVDAKKDIIALFTHPDVLADTDSDVCSAKSIRLFIPTTNQIIDLTCDKGECIKLKPTPEGTTHLQVKDITVRLPVMHMWYSFQIDLDVFYDFRTASFKPHTHVKFKAHTMPGRHWSTIVAYINMMGKRYVGKAFNDLHEMLARGEKDQEHIDLWPGFDAMDFTYGEETPVEDQLKDLLCKILNDQSVCDTVEIITNEQNLLDIRYGKEQKAIYIVDNSCSKALIDIGGRLLKHELDWKATLKEVAKDKTLLRQLSSDSCAVYHIEKPVKDQTGVTELERMATISCGDPRIPNKCIKQYVNDDGIVNIEIGNLFVSMPSLFKQKSFISFKTFTNIVFDMATFEVPPGPGIEFIAQPLTDELGFDERMEIDYYNDTGKPTIETNLQKLRDQMTTYESQQQFAPQYEMFTGSGAWQKELDRFLSLLPKEPSRYRLGDDPDHGFDLAQLFFDVLTALRGIPECVKDAGHHLGQCPKKCFESLYTLRSNVERDAGDLPILLEAAHVLGYMTEEFEKFCSEAVGWDWAGMPNPRPPFNIYDIIVVGTEASKCAHDLERWVVTRNGNCLQNCASTIEQIGKIVSKYIHVTLGKFIEKMSEHTDKVCVDTQGPCFEAQDGAACAAQVPGPLGQPPSSTPGQCKDGECVATSNHHQPELPPPEITPQPELPPPHLLGAGLKKHQKRFLQETFKVIFREMEE